MRPLITAVLAATVALAGTAQAQLVYDFNSGSQGWTVVDGADLVHRVDGGNGFLTITDTTLGDFRLVLPAPGLGDWSAYLGGALSFDARNASGDAPDWPRFGELTLEGAGISLTADGVAPNQPAADGAWHTYSIRLDTATFGSSLPTVLAGLMRLELKGEFHDTSDGRFEALDVDNIRVSAVPELNAWALFLAGGLMLPALRRRCG